MTCASSSPPDSMRFDERAESYGAHAAPQKRFAEALAAFAPFRRGVRVTELGAGTGFLTAALLAQGVNVDATDSSPAMVELGRQSVAAHVPHVGDCPLQQACLRRGRIRLGTDHHLHHVLHPERPHRDDGLVHRLRRDDREVVRGGELVDHRTDALDRRRVRKVLRGVDPPVLADEGITH
ncbi:MAG: hypothetical protein RJA51_1170 [Actinomycetota bacterium]